MSGAGLADRLRRFARRWPVRATVALPRALGSGVPDAPAAAALPWHHLPDGRFRNPPGSPRSGGEFGDWWWFFFRRLIAAEPQIRPPPGHLLDEAATREGIARAQGRDGVTWLGHATFLIRLDGVTILTDPYLTAHASPLPPFGPRRFTPPPLPPERLPPVDLVLLSHNHYEHLDLRTLAVLSRTQRPVLVTTLGVSRHVDHAEFSRVLELDWHQGIALLGIELRALPAIHFSRRTPFDRNRSLWCGFRVAGARHALVFAGDTAFGPVHREIGERYPPVDVALVPIGAYAPRLLMQGAHCTPEEGFRIGQDLRARCICAMHWGTIRLTDEPPFEPPLRFCAAAAAAGYGPDRAWLPAVGETRLL